MKKFCKSGKILTNVFTVTLLLLNSVFVIAQVQISSQKYRSKGVKAELIEVVSVAEKKIISLAEIMPVKHYDWRPGQGIRSVSEVYMHIAGTNYWLPIMLGYLPPEEIPISDDFNTIIEYEKITDKDTVINILEGSFKHLKKIIKQIPDARLDERMDIFETPGTVRSFLIFATTHIHEHLGQSIAYARINGVIPPWSRQNTDSKQN